MDPDHISRSTDPALSSESVLSDQLPGSVLGINDQWLGSMFRIGGWDLDQDGTTASTAVKETKICLTQFVFHVLR